MTSEPAPRRPRPARRSGRLALLAAPLALLVAPLALLAAASPLGAQADSAARLNDPRVGLAAGWGNAGTAARGLTLVGRQDRPAGFVDSTNPGNFAFVNSDLAFSGNYVFQGNYNGVQVWDISNPARPTLRTTFVCPGGQGDVSVYRNLLFMSVEETRGRVDCGTQGVTDTVSAERFRGVRIFDISNIEKPVQVAAVQTCRGSHTHTLVTDPNDSTTVYVYGSGTGPVRSGAELTGCSALPPDQDPNTSLFSIDVIRVPLARPQDAKVIASPRVFADSAGAIAGLWKGGNYGEGTQSSRQTNQCHDITAYPAIGLAAGACAGNGILLDIRNPAAPKRVAEVSDPNFAYWHSATFGNEGKKVVFTDEWGGGVQPRCRASDRREWGADAIFTLTGDSLVRGGYYKPPAPQTAQENCVAHNGSLIPVPGRDIMVQAWYQGGISVFDFTDPSQPVEIAYFDRGPMDSTRLVLGGYWSAYWYNGNVVGSEIGRGLDIFALAPTAQLSANEIAAARLVQMDLFNPQDQQKVTWPARFVVARAYLDQLVRNQGLSRGRTSAIARALDSAERLSGARQRTALTRLATQLDRDAAGAEDAARVRALATTVRELAAAQS